MSLPEVLLWRALRARPSGLRFRRQHPAGDYVLDFFCPAHRLAIEVDGEAHNRGDRPQRDIERDAYLGRQHVRVIRIAATDVLADVAAVVRYIESAACAVSYPATTGCAGGPPPPPGEDR